MNGTGFFTGWMFLLERHPAVPFIPKGVLLLLTVSKTQSTEGKNTTDPSQWPGLVLSSSTTGHLLAPFFLYASTAFLQAYSLENTNLVGNWHECKRHMISEMANRKIYNEVK